MESKDIMEIKINETKCDTMINYIEMIKTPFNDYGILYNTPIKLIWCLTENNIDITKFSKFYMKFESFYFDEEKLELNEHYIEMFKKDLNDIIISKRMIEIIKQKKKEDVKKKI
jgi:hypothetical protein